MKVYLKNEKTNTVEEFIIKRDYKAYAFAAGMGVFIAGVIGVPLYLLFFFQ